MSIIINGMDMPKGNSTKNLLIYSDGRVFTGHKDDINYFAEELPSVQPDPLNDIDRMKYFVCCPMCDLPKCVKGTPQCEAEQWAEARRKEGEQDEAN